MANKIKTLLVPIFIVSSCMAIHAQGPIQLTAQTGTALTLLNKNIFPNKPILISPLFGAAVNKPLSKNFTLGIEAQYSRFNLGSRIQQQYQRFITNASVQRFSPTTVLNGMLNIGYAKNTGISKADATKSSNGFGFQLGVGVQRLTAGGNFLQVTNPFQGNQLNTVYREPEGDDINPLLQLTVTRSWYIRPCLALDINLKAQYIRYTSRTFYKPVPADINQNNLDIFFANPGKEEFVQRPFTVMPTIGLRFAFGCCKVPGHDTDPQQPTASCFAMQWRNAVPKDSCFRGDTLKFSLAQNNIIPGATIYEIYIAPVNDLNNEKLLYSMPYPATSFTINPVLLDANREYVVIVKLRNPDKTKECLQYTRPVKRCADCCKDVKFPK